jgi:hypothetical protein
MEKPSEEVSDMEVAFIREEVIDGHRSLSFHSEREDSPISVLNIEHARDNESIGQFMTWVQEEILELIHEWRERGAEADQPPAGQNP